MNQNPPAPEHMPPPPAQADRSSHILEVRDLAVDFHTRDGSVHAVDGVNLAVKSGQILALVGEDGCGKSTIARAIAGTIPKPGQITRGQILLHPRNGPPVNLASPGAKSRSPFLGRGGCAGIVHQEPPNALDPARPIGEQIRRAILLQQKVAKKTAAERAAELLRKVSLPSSGIRLEQMPAQWSPGMRQRAEIAMALARSDDLLIADEPTGALDSATQAQILAMLRSLAADRGTAVLLITRDLAVAAQAADEVAVVYLGRIVEQGRVRAVLKNPLHPYTIGLLHSIPDASVPCARLTAMGGGVPALTAIPSGCPFHPRCAYSLAGLCNVGPAPRLLEYEGQRHVACHRVVEVWDERFNASKAAS